MFSRFSKESGQDVRIMVIKANRKVDAMEAAWKKAGSCRDYFVRMTEAEKFLKDCLSVITGTGFSRKDVREFCLRLATYQEEEGFNNKAGLFLTALISKGRWKRYDVETSHLFREIDYLGYQNRKTIFVYGNLGGNCGLHMEGGSITVDGSVGNDAGGCMRGGSLHVTGNAGNNLGWYMIASTIDVLGNAGTNCGMQMFSGKIHVKGNVLENCGVQMGGGDIYVCGDIGSVSSDIKNGKIYHKGKPIYGR